MTHVIQGGWSAGQGALLSQMYQERKKVFIDLLRWDLPALDGRYEIDEFDTPATIYLIMARSDGTHLGSLRLLPTTQPNVLGSVFPSLCDATPPQGPDVWEISRLCLSRSIRADERRQVRDQLAIAMERQMTLEHLVRLAVDHADYVLRLNRGAHRHRTLRLFRFRWRCRLA